jgi:predicted TPR repeat methyltransferase
MSHPLPPDALQRAIDLYRSGDDAAAEALAHAIVAADPGSVGALSMSGVFEARRGHFSAAAQWFRRAVAADPGARGAHLNLGHALDALGAYPEAVAHYEQAIALGERSSHAFLRLGTANERAGRPIDALAAFDAALRLDPCDVAALYERVDVLIALGRERDALQTLDAAEAAGGDVERVAYARAALGVAPPVPASPAGYVRDLFDGYADGFDAHLVGHLQYTIPERIAALLQRHGTGAGLDVLDAGCGTGLCGAYLAEHARRLDGVDLSARMLAHAERRGCYHRLACAELIAHLEAHPAAWDLVVAADVVIYFGDLVPLFAAVHRALRPGGRFAFSTEHTEQAGVVLNRTRRFAHSRAHVAQASAGFRLLDDEPVTARRERGVDVASRLVLLERLPASATGS